jgi:glyoxylase-like metal-dependent hydrolase (beta-lactamase superfamily II)
LTANGVAGVAAGILRITFALPLGIDHVHCYALQREDGSWLVIDTGLGVPDAQARWRSVLQEHDLRVARIVITHFHPDHVGAAAPLAELTGAHVHQGAVDYAQCVRAWGGEQSFERLVAYMREHGLPAEEAEQLRVDGNRLARFVHYVRDPEPLAPGDDVDGWDVLHLPGHADGHLCLLRDGVLIAGDALLATITPNVGLYPEARPDPLGDYLDSLSRIVELAPATAYAGHGDTIEDPPQRARDLIEHHHERLARTREALSDEPRTAYDVSLTLFPGTLTPVLRRFALAESRAHLEYLALRDQAARSEGDGRVGYHG